MAWRRMGDKSLSEPMLIRLTDCIYAALGEDELEKNVVPQIRMYGE